MKNSKLVLCILSCIPLVLSSCIFDKADEDPNDERGEDPTIEVISPEDGDVYYTSEGANRQADFHFWGRDDVTVDYVSITVLNSSGEQVHHEKKIIRQTTLEVEMFRNFSTENADSYTVVFEVSDTAKNIVEATRTIFFENRVDTDLDAFDN